MRRLRALRRQARIGSGHSLQQVRIETSHYLHHTTRIEERGSGKVWVRHSWEGRVQVKGYNHVVTRSVAKHGARGAYLQCLNQVGEWLHALYPADWVEAKLLQLMDNAPEV